MLWMIKNRDKHRDAMTQATRRITAASFDLRVVEQTRSWAVVVIISLLRWLRICSLLILRSIDKWL
jgi:hypothetical protein